MRLKKLILKNYGCHKALELDMAAATKILGPGGSGKSTLIAAAEMCVLGINDRTTDLKASAFRPIATYGESEASVVTEWDDPTHGEVTFARSFAGPLRKDQAVMLTVGGVQQTGTREALEKQFTTMTCKPVIWRLLFDSDKFATLDADACSKFLYALTSGGVGKEDIEERLKKVIDPKLLTIALRIWNAEENPLDFDRTLGRLQRQRPDKRRVVEGYEKLLAAQAPVVDAAQLSTLQMKKNGLDQQIKAAQAIPDPTREIAEIQERIAAYDESHADIATLEKKAAGRAAFLKGMRERQTGDIGSAAELKQLEAAYFDAGRYFGDAEEGKPAPKCPVCTTKITKTLLKSIQTNLEAMKAKVGNVAKSTAAIADAEELLHGAERAVMEAKAAEKQYDGWKTELARLQNEDLPKWKSRPDVKALNDHLVTVLGELKGLEEAKQKAAERADAESKLAGAKLEWEAIQALITAYEPDGIRKEIASGATDFVENVRQGVRFYFGPQSDINFQTGKVTRDGVTWEPLTGLSDSEAARVGIAVQLGLGQATGVFLCMTDHLAEMTPADQKRTILLLATNMKDKGSALLLTQIPDSPTESGKAITPEEFVALERKRLETKQFAEMPNDQLAVYALDTAHAVTRLK